MKPEKVQNFGDNTLFERPAQPAELAPLFVWLASKDASYVTAKCTGPPVVALRSESLRTRASDSRQKA